MLPDKKECEHIAATLRGISEALVAKNVLRLKELSNKTTHDSFSYQDAGSTTVAVLAYALSKLVERDDPSRIPRWDAFVKRFNTYLSAAAGAVEKCNEEAYLEHLENARKTLTSVSPNLKAYIQDVLRKASINKGARIYEHGLSMEQTANILGISQWELSEYVSQRDQKQTSVDTPMTISKRAKMALEFFS